MKLVVSVRLFPSAAVAAALRETLVICNEAANVASAVMFEQKVRTAFDLHHRVYYDLRSGCGLSAQPTARTIKKVADAYRTFRSNARAGNYGRAGCDRRAAAPSKPIRFAPLSAQPFDDRCLSWQYDTRTVSIWTVKGRLKGVPFKGSPDQIKTLATHRQGETDLQYRDGMWFLLATCDVEAPTLNLNPAGWLGVDLGIVNIATTSTGVRWSGGSVTYRRKKNQHLRTRLQHKNTKSAKRLLKKRGRKETRFVADTNHKISKHIVVEAQRTGHGIAIENLGGIRSRARLRKPQRATLNSWAFAQLGQHLTYKTEQAGVPLMIVNPAYTSQRCFECGHTEKANRDRENFTCRSCGVVAHADHNAAKNIAHLAETNWQQVAVNQPHAA